MYDTYENVRSDIQNGLNVVRFIRLNPDVLKGCHGSIISIVKYLPVFCWGHVFIFSELLIKIGQAVITAFIGYIHYIAIFVK
jgi:hypothetical protein